MVGIRFLFFHNVEKKEYISWLSGPLMLVSIITALYWFIWTYLKDENEWSLIVSLMDAEKAGCDPDFTTYPECDDGDGDPCFTINEKNLSINYKKDCDTTCTQIYNSCPDIFISWAGPF